MPAFLGPNRYGKAECRLVRVTRGGDRHDLVDLNVSTSLSGELSRTHLTGDNTDVLPTDTQKNTVYAFARRYGIASIEEFALRLAEHFVTEQPMIHQAEVRIEQYPWQRIGGHSFARSDGEVRSATVTWSEADGAEVTGELHGLTLLNTTDSEFWGFTRDRYTTLAPTTDRILATAVDASWEVDRVDEGRWNPLYAEVRKALVDAFVGTYSHSLQQTLYAMGEAVLAAVPEVRQVRLALPNRHHFLVDLSPFDLDNPDEVYFPADRPYGLIEGTVLRDRPEPAIGPGPTAGQEPAPRIGPGSTVSPDGERF
ncbi:urate oxidase [Micromonospora sp. CPCC 206060]|uniref:factor-independent urate hydroxylase n=1 Tax=Micromonospora sp. CPCC 206060 TaxID=3122406 RepID=UPI002FEF6D3E